MMRVWNVDSFKEIHIKVFNTGKLEIPGVRDDLILTKTLNLLVKTLQPFHSKTINYKENTIETVLINSNFTCNYYINRDNLFNILKYKQIPNIYGIIGIGLIVIGVVLVNYLGKTNS